jgi:hypothetical protein
VPPRAMATSIPAYITCIQRSAVALLQHLLYLHPTAHQPTSIRPSSQYTPAATPSCSLRRVSLLCATLLRSPASGSYCTPKAVPGLKRSVANALGRSGSA